MGCVASGGLWYVASGGLFVASRIRGFVCGLSHIGVCFRGVCLCPATSGGLFVPHRFRGFVCVTGHGG